MYPPHNPTIPNQKKKHRNPFTFLFTKQYKSTPTMSIPAEKQGIMKISCMTCEYPILINLRSFRGISLRGLKSGLDTLGIKGT